jgi:predicted metalloprotease with PDZ domain
VRAHQRAFPLLGANKSHTTTARLLEKEPTNMQAQSLDTLIDKAVKRGMLPTFHFRKLADGAQRDILVWPSQAVLRQWAHFY